MRKRRQVWPPGAADGLEKDLAREFPQVLLIRHPVTGRWQAYEARSPDWDAEGLYTAIARYYSGLDGDLGKTWWFSKSAPVLFEEDLPRPPGDWVISYLRERDLWRIGGARAFFAAKEERERRWRESRRREVHDFHRGWADDARRVVRDAMPVGISATDSLKEIRERERRGDRRLW